MNSKNLSILIFLNLFHFKFMLLNHFLIPIKIMLYINFFLLLIFLYNYQFIINFSNFQLIQNFSIIY